MPADLIPLCDKEPPFFFFFFGGRERATSEDKVPPRFTRNLPSFLPFFCLLPSVLSPEREQREAVKLGALDTHKNKKTKNLRDELDIIFSLAASNWGWKKCTNPVAKKRVEEGNLWGGKTGSVLLFVTCAAQKYIFLRAGSFSLMNKTSENLKIIYFMRHR